MFHLFFGGHGKSWKSVKKCFSCNFRLGRSWAQACGVTIFVQPNGCHQGFAEHGRSSGEAQPQKNALKLNRWVLWLKGLRNCHESRQTNQIEDVAFRNLCIHTVYYLILYNVYMCANLIWKAWFHAAERRRPKVSSSKDPWEDRNRLGRSCFCMEARLLPLENKWNYCKAPWTNTLNLCIKWSVPWFNRCRCEIVWHHMTTYITPKSISQATALVHALISNDADCIERLLNGGGTRGSKSHRQSGKHLERQARRHQNRWPFLGHVFTIGSCPKDVFMCIMVHQYSQGSGEGSALGPVGNDTTRLHLSDRLLVMLNPKSSAKRVHCDHRPWHIAWECGNSVKLRHKST